MKQPELLKIGDFAKLAGTNLRTLRYYEELDLLHPAKRSDGGFRYYRPTDVHRLRTIQALQHLGLSLEQIHELIAMPELTQGADGEDTEQARARHFERIEAALDAQDRLIEERIAELREHQERLRAARGKLSECQTCDVLPTAENNHCDPCSQSGEPLPDNLRALF